MKEYKKNAKSGDGPISPAEERKIEADRRKAEQEQITIEEKKNILFRTSFNDIYLPNFKTNKKPESWRKESEHFDNWLNLELSHLPMKNITTFNLERVKKNMQDAGRAPRSIQYVFATF